jgi:AbrB family looped-hinge helix DNA binding protein
MAAATVSSKGGVVIPAPFRKKYGLRPGTRVQVVDYGGVISLHPVLNDPIKQARGSLKGGPSLTAALLREHAKERERENR